jgi:CRISPR-associated Csx14 family protein
MATVLIASLGDSPVVITSMFDLLKEEAKQHRISPIGRLEVLCPDEAVITIGYQELIFKYLQQECEIDKIALSSEDVNGEQETYLFLHTLSRLLVEHQKNADTVYLSLAGGRKSMSALMALLAPLFPCVKKLYHILDKDEEKAGHFWSTAALYDLPTSEQPRVLFPSHERVNLIDIPYGERQYASRDFLSRLHTITDDQLDDLWESDPEQAEIFTYYGQMTTGNGPGGILRVELTKEVIERYREMRRFNVTHAQNFRKCFQEMHYAVRLDQRSKDIHTYKGKHFHFYKRRRTPERPVFYTDPVDIKANPDAYIERVVVVALEIEVEGTYPPLKKIVKELTFPLETEQFEIAFPQNEVVEKKEYILLIPLATSPMIATQLYALYTARGYTIRKVVLVHTEHSRVRESVSIVEDAFQFEGIDCEVKALQGWEDIDTPEACAAYQETLEQMIESTRAKYPDCQIELTIAGGRKGMAALAMFAAQQQEIHRVTHTLITDETVSTLVSRETTIAELQRLGRINKKRRNDRLFLRAYADYKDAFTLFHIPVVPAQKG